MENNIAKWYFICIGVILAFVVCATAVYQWRQMDCRLSLGQSGRPVAEITQICN